MIIKAYLTAFGQGEVREIDVPDAEAAAAGQQAILDLAYHYGQNDFQPQPRPSLSTGDVIELAPDARFRVAFGGFIKLVEDEDPLRLMGRDAMDEGMRREGIRTGGRSS